MDCDVLDAEMLSVKERVSERDLVVVLDLDMLSWKESVSERDRIVFTEKYHAYTVHVPAPAPDRIHENSACIAPGLLPGVLQVTVLQAAA